MTQLTLMMWAFQLCWWAVVFARVRRWITTKTYMGGLCVISCCCTVVGLVMHDRFAAIVWGCSSVIYLWLWRRAKDDDDDQNKRRRLASKVKSWIPAPRITSPVKVTS